MELGEKIGARSIEFVRGKRERGRERRGRLGWGRERGRVKKYKRINLIYDITFMIYFTIVFKSWQV